MRDHRSTSILPAALSAAPASPLKYSNVFDVLEAELATSSALPIVLVEPGECGPDSPAAAVTVRDARAIVQDSEVPDPILDAIWTALLHRARSEPPRWEPILLWLMVPRLRGIANRLGRTWRIDMQDIRSEVILAFLNTVRQVDPGQPKLGPHLWWNTYGRARQACWQATREVACEDIELLGARQAVPDDCCSLDETMHEATTANNQHDHKAIEGERLGSLAARLGLRAVVDGRNAEDAMCPVTPILRLDKYRRRSLQRRLPRTMNTRGNGCGEAA